MATGIFAILDDIALLMDDTAAMSKIAVKKTAGLLGDDLAVNAEKATGFHSSRELPVIWAITKGSFLNKLIILPLAFLLSAFAPWLVLPILLVGGSYLSYEGAEKVWEWLSGHKHTGTEPAAKRFSDPKTLIKEEKRKIKAAIRTDFILSIEIIVIALETVIEQSLAIQISVVSLIAIVATIGVYGIVALLVRMDDTGFFLQQRAHQLSGMAARLFSVTGKILVSALPKVIRILAFIGTLAMLLVGGGMYVHNIEYIHHLLAFLPGFVADLAAGLIMGGLLVIIMHFIKKLSNNKTKHQES